MIAAIAIGFMGSLHCVGMCGPLVLSMPFNTDEKGSYGRILSYQSGRILTYALLGLVTGLVGDALRFFFLQQYISIGAGVFMLAVYFLPKIFKSFGDNTIANIWNRKIITRMKTLLLGSSNRPTNIRLFNLGLINGLLPCGLVYMALLGAISQPNVVMAMLFMVIFGIGTSPALTAIIFSKKWLQFKGKLFYSRVAPILVITISILLILRGLGLGIPFVSPAGAMPSCH